MLKVIPKADRIVVRRYEQPERVGNIFIPDEAKNMPQMGEVLSVGEGRAFDGPGLIEGGWSLFGGASLHTVRLGVHRAPVTVAVGDKVLFSKFSGTEVEVNGETVFILREDEILAVVEEIPGEVTEEAPAPAAADIP